MEAGKGKMVRNFKYKPGGNMLKQIWLPASAPDDGTAGADVILIVDPHVRRPCVASQAHQQHREHCARVSCGSCG